MRTKKPTPWQLLKAQSLSLDPMAGGLLSNGLFMVRVGANKTEAIAFACRHGYRLCGDVLRREDVFSKE